MMQRIVIQTQRWIAMFISFLLLWTPLVRAQVEKVQESKITFSAKSIPLSLKDALESGLRENTAMRIAEEKIRESKQLAWQKLTALLPHIEGTLSESRRRIFLSSMGLNFAGIDPLRPPFQVFDMRFSGAMDIVNLNALFLWQAAHRGVKLSKYEEALTRQNTAAAIATLYLKLQRADSRIQAIDANILLARDLLKDTEDRQAAGMVTRLDTTRAKFELSSQINDLLVAKKDREDARVDLLKVIGCDQTYEVTLTEPLKFHETPLPAFEEALVVAFNNRTELVVAQQQKSIANSNLHAAEAELLPKITVTGDYGITGDRAVTSEPTGVIGGQISTPLFESGQILAKIREKKSLVRQSNIDLEDTEDQVALEVQQALVSLDSAHQQVKTALDQLQLAREEVEFAVERFKNGLINNTEVVDAQTDLANARDIYIDALTTYRLAQIDLVKAMGQIDQILLKDITQSVDRRGFPCLAGRQATPHGKMPDARH